MLLSSNFGNVDNVLEFKGGVCMKKFISFIFVLSVLMFLTSDLKAHAQENDVMEEISSSQDYIEYLKSKNDESTTEVLEQFLQLNKEDQELFLQALEPQNYLKLLNTAQNNPNENTTVELDNGQKIDVRFSTEQNNEQDVNNQAALSLVDFTPYATTYYKVTTPWATNEMAILGVTTSKFQVKMVLQSDGVDATKVYEVQKNYVNNNPFVWTTDVGYTTPYVSGGYGYGGYQWKISATGSMGALSSNLDMLIKANHTKGYYKVNSGRSDWAVDWTAFYW